MVITTTAVAFITSSFGLGLCGFLFLRAFRKMGGLATGNKASFLFLGLIFSTAIQHSIMGFGNLFFAQSSTALQGVVVVANIFLALSSAFGTYLISYLFLTKLSPWPVTIITSLLGFAVVLATGLAKFSPFVDVGGGIDWNFPHWLEVLIYLLVFVNIATLLCASVAMFFRSKNPAVRIVSLALIIVTSLGLMNIFLRFILLPATVGPLRTRFFDVTLITIGLVLITGLLMAPFLRKRISDYWMSKGGKKDMEPPKYV